MILILALWPALALGKLREPPWDSQVALVERDGKPLLAFAPWGRWQAALGNSAVQLAYASSAQPAGASDWVLAPVPDPKLATYGSESAWRLALFSSAGAVYYGLEARYTRPDGRLLRQGMLWGQSALPCGARQASSAEVNWDINASIRWPQIALLDGRPVFVYVSQVRTDNKYSFILQAATTKSVTPDALSQWPVSVLDSGSNINAPALAVAGSVIFVCYWAQPSATASGSGFVLQRGSVEPDGTLRWRVLRVLHPAGETTGELQLLAGAGRIYLFTCTKAGLELASCAIDQLEQQDLWDTGLVYAGARMVPQAVCMIADLPAVLYTDYVTDCCFALARTPTPRQPRDWSGVLFPAGGAGPAALAVVDGKPAIAYQCETPRAIAYAWATQAVPRQAADWRTGLVLREADIHPIQLPYYSTVGVDAGLAQLAAPREAQFHSAATTTLSTWRAVRPAAGVAAGAALRWQRLLLIGYILTGVMIVSVVLYVRRRINRRQRGSRSSPGGG